MLLASYPFKSSPFFKKKSVDNIKQIKKQKKGKSLDF